MKVSIIGIGSVGSAVATAVNNTGLFHEMVLFDRDGMRSHAAAEDLEHASVFGFDIKITAASNYREVRGSDIVIISAGANQKPGQTRTDLLKANTDVINDIIPNVMKHVDNKKVIIIIATNPLDVMVMRAQKLSGLPEHRVIGTGTMLDSARFRVILSRYLGVSVSSISAYVMGEHGDSSVLNWSAVSIGNIGLDNFCRQTKISMLATTRRTITHRVKNAAYEIIQGRGATWDGIGAACADLCRCVINDEKRILTVSVCDGVGKKRLAMSLPRIVGRDGAIISLMPDMNKPESDELAKSRDIIRKNYESIKK